MGTLASNLTRDNLGFLLAKAMQRWNELLYKGFCGANYGDIRPSYGSVLVPLFEEDGLRIGELANRSRMSKQTMTTLIRHMTRKKLVLRKKDDADGRASKIYLTVRTRRFRPVAERVLRRLDDGIATALGASQKSKLQSLLKKIQEVSYES